MNQAFFTLSLGIGAMEIFGSYMSKEHTLLGESLRIAALDTFVAIMSGLIIFPACFAYGINPGAGPELIFITLPNVFVQMPGGRFWGALFFLFMTFAAFSTIIGVFENIITTLSEEDFTPDDIKYCYNLRWGIETSFRDLKHPIGAINLHSKKTEYVAFELWSRLILYNFCSIIITFLLYI